MRHEVVRARERQAERFANSSTRYNAQMSSRDVRKYCELDKGCQQMLRHSVEEMGLSARAHDKILRVSRTIADIAGDEHIDEMHMAEAIGYRNLDRDLWT
jgi:magnesium chelatase family protein